MTGTDFLDSFDQIPGGALMARRVRFEQERAEHCARWAKETLDREQSAREVCPLFPAELVTPNERGKFVLRALAVGDASENLQDIATHPGTHRAMRRHAAHVARMCLSAFLNLFAEHQRILRLAPQYRVVTSGPLAVAWVAGGHIRWELNQFDLVGPDGDLSLLADLPAHIDTKHKLVQWTEAHCEDEPTPPGVGVSGVCGVSRT